MLSELAVVITPVWVMVMVKLVRQVLTAMDILEMSTNGGNTLPYPQGNRK